MSKIGYIWIFLIFFEKNDSGRYYAEIILKSNTNSLKSHLYVHHKWSYSEGGHDYDQTVQHLNRQ